MKAPLVGFPSVRNPCDRDLCWDSSTASHHNKAPRGFLLKGQCSSKSYVSTYLLNTELWIISRSCKGMSFSSLSWTFQARREYWKVETVWHGLREPAAGTVETYSTHSQITPSVGENGTDSVVVKACLVQGCLCGVRIPAPRQYSASLWYEVVCAIWGVIGATTLLRDRQSCSWQWDMQRNLPLYRTSNRTNHFVNMVIYHKHMTTLIVFFNDFSCFYRKK